MASARVLHYRVALATSIFVLISAVTGLLWAYAPYLYWKPGYLAKEDMRPLMVSDVHVLPSDLRSIVESANGPASRIVSALLKDEAGVPMYDITLAGGGHLLVDARDGSVLSPLSRELAIEVAKQYVPKEPAVHYAEEFSPWNDRKGKVFRRAWVVRFSDSDQTEIVLDAENGAILEDSDRVRRFHFWVMKLHQFNFFGTHKVLTIVSGAPLLFLLVTGAVLGVKRYRLGRRGHR